MAFEYLAEYVTFESVEEMDKQINERIDTLQFDLTKAQRAVVFAIKSHCLAYPGACHLKNKTIAEETGVSLITVGRAISRLVELKIIGKTNRQREKGGKGANIYFFIPQNDVSEMMHRETIDEASNDKGFEQVSENLSINSFNLLKTSSLENIYNNAHAEKEASKEYMNEYQQMLFDFMHSLPLADQLKDDLHKVVLAVQVNSVEEFIKAKNVFFKIAMDIKEGVLTVKSTLRAVFVGAYSKDVERKKNKPTKISSVEEKSENKRSVPFYNWLKERDSRPQVNSSRPCNLENWLEW